MRQNPDASFYALEVSVEPGGAREYLLFLLNDLDAVRQETENCLAHSAYLMLWYGRTIQLTTFHDGQAVDAISLMPFITYYIGDLPPLHFDDKGNPTGLSREQIRADKSLTERLWQHDAGQQKPESPPIRYTVDWAQLQPPPLSGNLLQPGDRTLLDEMVLGYGGNDLENGLYFGEGEEETDMSEWEDEWKDANPE